MILPPNKTGRANGDEPFTFVVFVGRARRGTGARHLTKLQPAAAKGTDLDINIANILEREYATYEAAKIHKQLDWKANIVVVQCAENVPPKEFDAAAFQRSLQTLLNDLKESSNPHIFVTSNILWGNPGLDEIKRKACDEEPAHRTFVDIKRSRLRRSKFMSVTVRAVSST